MDVDRKITRQEEEGQTLQKFLENQGEKFDPGFVSYLGIQEPCDVSYKGVEYQITYGNRKLLGDIKRELSNQGESRKIDSQVVGLPPTIDYVKEILETALKDKKDKSDGKMTLLVEPAYTSYWSFSKEEMVFEKYFKDNEQSLGGLWQSIFIVFPDRNIKLR